MAVIFLVVGHYSAFCLEGSQPSENMAEVAVVIFLFLSGAGLTKSYGLNKIQITYWINRLKKIMIPLWTTLILFYLLDFFLLQKRYGVTEMLPKFIGIIGKSPPNGSAWFVSYIMYLYIVFYAISYVEVRLPYKVILIFLLCYLTNKVISWVPTLDSLFNGWSTYTYVFPCSILITLNKNRLVKLLKKLDRASRALIILALIGIFLTYLSVDRFKTACLIVLISTADYLISSSRLKFNVLKWIGAYSYEIYLLHLPFMVSYSFLGQGLPQTLRRILYIILITTMSVIIKRMSITLSDYVFPELTTGKA